MKITHKIIGAIWILVGFLVLVTSLNSVAHRSARKIESRQEWKENFSYPIWRGGDYYHDRKLDGEVFIEFSVGDYNRAYSEHTYWIKLLISKDTPPTKFKLHFGHWDKIEKISRVKKSGYIKPYALFYTDNDIPTLPRLKAELAQWYRKNVFYDKNVALLAIKLTHPERDILEAHICFPSISGKNPKYGRGKNSQFILSDSTGIELNMSKPLTIDIVKPMPPIGELPSKLHYVTMNIFGCVLAFFTRTKIMFFSWGIVGIIVAHFQLSKEKVAKNKSKKIFWGILGVSYVCVLGSIAIYITFVRAMAAF